MESKLKQIGKNSNSEYSNVKLTDDQDRAISGLLEFLNKPFDANDMSRALIGAAGVGKTFVVKYLIHESGYSSSVVGLAAPTHKAARVLREATGIKATTVQSDLGLRLNIDVDNFDINNPPFDPLAEKKIQGYKLYIVDEASMIGRNLKTLIERECKINKCKIIYVGERYCRL